MERARPHLRGELPETLARLWPDLDLSPRHARRIVSHLVGRDRDDLEGVRDLPRRLARAVAERSRTTRLEVLDRRGSGVDPFVKYLLRAPDGATFETVRIPLAAPRWSACVSCQAGCALGCAFCETGRLGLTRTLEPWEIVEQVLTVQREGPERPLTGVVFQGQGEPLHAYDSVIRAAEILRHPAGGRLSGDRMTISTVGLLPQLERYVEEDHPYRLILSLTSAFSDKRASLLPAGHAFDVAALARVLRVRAERRGEPVHLAWVLIAGFNTGPDEAGELALLFRGARVRLSLIDVNDPTGRFRPPDDGERGRFLDALRAAGLPFHRRYSGGLDIGAACGTLASSARGGAPRPPPATAQVP
jgi:23S rRNA (adenine2503-C2)-methyltransferase